MFFVVWKNPLSKCGQLVASSRNTVLATIILNYEILNIERRYESGWEIHVCVLHNIRNILPNDFCHGLEDVT